MKTLNCESSNAGSDICLEISVVCVNVSPQNYVFSSWLELRYTFLYRKTSSTTPVASCMVG